MTCARNEVLRSVARGERTPSAAAALLGVSEAEVTAELVALVTLGKELAVQAERKRVRRLAPRARAALAASAALVLGLATAFVAPPAWAQSACEQTLPTPLRTFCQGTPARASEVNANFATVAGWISGKTGALGSPDITTRDIVAHDVEARDLDVSGGVRFGSTTRQMLSLWNTEYGIGVQSSTQYFRTGSNFAWYRGGSHDDAQWSSGGGTTLMSLDSSGNLAARGELRGNTLHWGSCTWRGTGKDPFQNNVDHAVECSGGEFMVGWSCFASDYLDGNCRIKCCRPN